MPENDQATAAPASQGMRGEIANKWPKLTAEQIAGLATKDDLVRELQAAYALDAAQAQSEVDAFADKRDL